MEWRLLGALALLSLTPGALLVSIGGLWSYWRGVQRLVVIISASIAFYPLLFYSLAALPVAIRLGPYKLALFCGICWLVVIWQQRGYVLDLFRFERTEWLALSVIGLTLASRFWVAHQYPFPAWADSVHHVMLTKLIATQGRLPTTLEPYYPVPLQMYHLGLHSLAASVAWIAQAPFYSALLWTAQALNGLCGLGVYLVLDRKVGRVAAISGAVVVGLFSYQPAFYVNWGRFTQAAGQSLLLVAWLLTYETLQAWSARWEDRPVRWALLWSALLSALLTAGMLLTHFRVAAFYVLLLAPSLVYLLWQTRGQKQLILRFLTGALLIGGVTLLFVAIPFVEALQAYLRMIANPLPTVLTQTEASEAGLRYFGTDLSVVLMLTAQRWLIGLTIGAAVLGLLTRNKIVVLSLIWVALLCALGNTYYLGIRWLNVVNFTGAVIMFYLPIALIIGAVPQDLLRYVPQTSRPTITTLYMTILLLLALPGAWQRTQAIEAYRFFVTPADLTAMQWINENTPPDARFAVNTDFWLPSLPHGTDAGYWIPYFTDRKITAGAMLMNLADQTYRNQTVELSRLVVSSNEDGNALLTLYNRGVRYIYIGAKGNYTGNGLDINRLRASDLVKAVYEQDGVTILQIIPKSSS